MKKIGLTGGIGTGKSTVGWMFGELGVPVIMADEIAHAALEPRTKVWKQLFDRYGRKVLLNDDIIDRNELADIIFNNEAERRFVESIIHPRVHDEIEKRIAHLKNDGQTMVILEIPLLFESKWYKEMDSIIVVRCDYEEEVTRCETKFGLDREAALVRIKTQLPLEEKLKKADYIIDTSGPKSETSVQVRRICHSLQKGELHPKTS